MWPSSQVLDQTAARSCSRSSLATRRDCGQVLGWGRPHATVAGVRKAAALAVSLISFARWIGAAGPARMRPGRHQMAGAR